MGETLNVEALAALVEIHDDENALHAASVDSGRIVARKPRVVAAPRSARDVLEIVRWANRTGSTVALRGKGHTQAGQSLTSGGVQIDMQGVDAIGPVDEERRTLRVQAGATWREVVGYLGPRGWMPVVLTNNLDTTVGGTLATGGVGQSSHLYGTQANNVDELEAVTGDGRVLRCSATENASLFDATRAGLGQFSVITEARIRIRRVLPRVRTFRLVYDDLDTLLRDQAQILSRRRFHYLRAWCRHRDQRYVGEDDDRPEAGDWSYPMDVSVEFDAEPDEARLLAGLHHRRVFRTSDRDVAEFADLAEPTPLPAARHAALCAPVTEAWLPWSAATACVARLFETFPPAPCWRARTSSCGRSDRNRRRCSCSPGRGPSLASACSRTSRRRRCNPCCRSWKPRGVGSWPPAPSVISRAGSDAARTSGEPTSGGNGRRFCVGRKPSIRAAFSAMDSSAMARDHDPRRQRRDTGNCYTWRRHGCGSELHDTVGFAGRRSRGVVCGCLARVAPAHARVPDSASK